MAVCLGLFSPRYWGRTFLRYFLWYSMKIITLAGGNMNQCWPSVTFWECSLILWDGSFSSLGWFLHTHELITVSCPESEVPVPYFICDRTRVKRGEYLPEVYSASFEAELALAPRLLSSVCALLVISRPAPADSKGKDLASRSSVTIFKSQTERSFWNFPASSLLLLS